MTILRGIPGLDGKERRVKVNSAVNSTMPEGSKAVAYQNSRAVDEQNAQDFDSETDDNVKMVPC